MSRSGVAPSSDSTATGRRRQGSDGCSYYGLLVKNLRAQIPVTLIDPIQNRWAEAVDLHAAFEPHKPRVCVFLVRLSVMQHV